MNNILTEFNFVDIWRIQNPDIKRFTWSRHHPIVQSRLDYWFIPQEMIFSVDRCCIQAALKTDHKLITVQLTFNDAARRGPGLWKFNSLLLHDQEYITQVKQIIKEDYTIENKSNNWVYKKMKIREFTIAFSKQISKIRKKEEKLLITEHNNASTAVNIDPSEDNIVKLDQIQSKIEKKKRN